MADTSEIEIEDTVDRDDASAGTANTDNEAKDTYVQPISKKNSKGVDNYPRMTGKQHKKSFFTNRAKEELLKPHESHAALFKRGIHQPEKAALSWSKKERQNAEKVSTSIAHLKVLVGTWNVGNKEPPQELSPWIPENGGDYDIIAVAVQEASFRAKGTKSTTDDEDGSIETEEKQPGGIGKIKWKKAGTKVQSLHRLTTPSSSHGLSRASRLSSTGHIPVKYAREEDYSPEDFVYKNTKGEPVESSQKQDSAESEAASQDFSKSQADVRKKLEPVDTDKRKEGSSFKGQFLQHAGRISSLPANYARDVKALIRNSLRPQDKDPSESDTPAKRKQSMPLTCEGIDRLEGIQGGAKSVGLTCGSIAGVDNKIFKILSQYLNAERDPQTIAAVRAQNLGYQMPSVETKESESTTGTETKEMGTNDEGDQDVPPTLHKEEDDQKVTEKLEGLNREGKRTIEAGACDDITPETKSPGKRTVTLDKIDSLDKALDIDYDSDSSSLPEDHIDNSWVVVDHLMLGESLGLVVEIGLIVFARRKHVPAITQIQHDSQETGIMGLVGNKGGIGISFNLYGTPICFIGAHLAAHMHQMDRRNADIQEILEKIELGQEGVGLENQFGHVFIAGDLNYRMERSLVEEKINKRLFREFGIPSEKWMVKESESKTLEAILTRFVEEIVAENGKLQAYKDPTNKQMKTLSKSAMKKRKERANFLRDWLLTFSLIEVQRWKELMAADQLRLCQRKGILLYNFLEGTYNFPPSFKIERHSGFRYNKKRIPSYCDRVLWKSLPGMSSDIHCEYVSCYESITTSDHKPVAASFFLSMRAPPKLQSHLDGHLFPVIIFTKLQATHLLPADNTGFSDPYIYFSGDPPGLVQTGSTEETGEYVCEPLYTPSCLESIENELHVQKSRHHLFKHVQDCLEQHRYRHLSSCPRTSVQLQTLNPTWNCQTEVPILKLHCADPLQLSRSHLFMQIMDYDAGSKDDYIGTAILSLKTVAFGDNACVFDLPVSYNGRMEGTLSGNCEVVWPHDERYGHLKDREVFFPQACSCAGNAELCNVQ